MGLRRLGVLVAVVAVAAALAGCSGSGGGSPLAVGGAPRASNAADAAFVRSMSAHEKGSLAITRLGQRRAHRLELRRIARKMTDAQAADLAAFARVGTASAPAAAPPSSEAALGRVKHATSFDYEFMRTMIEQNEAAIAIARREIGAGSDPALKQLAGEIAAARQKELEQLRAWLKLLYGDIQPDPRPKPPTPAPQPTPAPPPEASPEV
jgi:uncharacterized protein (DUF305 family)